MDSQSIVGLRFPLTFNSYGNYDIGLHPIPNFQKYAWDDIPPRLPSDIALINWTLPVDTGYLNNNVMCFNNANNSRPDPPILPNTYIQADIDLTTCTRHGAPQPNYYNTTNVKILLEFDNGFYTNNHFTGNIFFKTSSTNTCNSSLFSLVKCNDPNASITFTASSPINNTMLVRAGYNAYGITNTPKLVFVANNPGPDSFVQITTHAGSSTVNAGDCCGLFNKSDTKIYVKENNVERLLPADKFAIIHDPTQHLFHMNPYYTRPAATSLVDKLRFLQDIQASSQDDAKTLIRIAHGPGGVGPRYNGISMDSSFFLDESKYYITIFDNVQINVNGKKVFDFVNADRRGASGGDLTRITDINSDFCPTIHASNCIYKFDSYTNQMNIIDTYIVIPYSSHTEVLDVYVAQDPCTTYLKPDESWDATVTTSRQTRIGYLGNDVYGVAENLEMRIPLFLNRDYVCIETIHGWEMYNVKTMPLDGINGVTIVGNTVDHSSTEPNTRHDLPYKMSGNKLYFVGNPGGGIGTANRLYSTSLTATNTGTYTLEINYDISTAISGLAATKRAANFYTPQDNNWRITSDQVFQSRICIFAFDGNGAQLLNPPECVLQDGAGNNGEAVLRNNYSGYDTEGNADRSGGEYCVSRWESYHDPQASGTITRNVGLDAGEQVTIEIRGYVYLEGAQSGVSFCGESNFTERLIGEVDINRLFVRLR